MPEFHFPLVNKQEVAEETTAFTFDTSGTGFTFEAGQHGDFFLEHSDLDAANSMHTFSFASSPNNKDQVLITTRMRNSPFKNTLKALPFGTKVKVVGPLGNMVLHDDATKPAVFLAGGIGITPFRSMILWATEQTLSHKLFLFYSNRTKSSTPFLPDLLEAATKNKNLTIIPSFTDEEVQGMGYERGRINADMIRKQVRELTTPIWYMAGPPAMTNGMRTLLLELGVSRDNMRMEEFTGY